MCVLAIGKLVAAAEKAAATLEADGIKVEVWDVRSCAPLDEAMLTSAAQNSHVLTFEDGLRDGGIGMAIADRITSLNSNVNVHVHGVPTKFIPQAKPDAIQSALGLDADGIVAAVLA